MDDAAQAKARFESGQPVIINNVLYNDHARVGAWVNMHFGKGPIEVPFFALGVPRSEMDEADLSAMLNGDNSKFDLAGGAYYFNAYVRRKADGSTWKECCVALVITDRSAISRAVTLKLLEYPFVQLKCDVLRAEIPVTSKDAIDEAERLGFDVVGMFGPKDSEVAILALTPDKCPVWQNAKKAA